MSETYSMGGRGERTNDHSEQLLTEYVAVLRLLTTKVEYGESESGRERHPGRESQTGAARDTDIYAGGEPEVPGAGIIS